jgi:putative tryptophan/tyrosine transport system substrate-binding protein
MTRRQTIRLLLGATASWSLGARAQRPALPVIGYLSSASTRVPGLDRAPDTFRAGLLEGGYDVDRNVAIEVLSADGHYDRLPALAATLVRRRVTLIVASGGILSAEAAAAATSTIPILFIAGFDPVKLGLVKSLSRPGGNATGFSVYTTELLEKRFELLRELVPHAGVTALMVNPLSPVADIETEDMAGVARSAGLGFLALRASNESELQAAFASARDGKADALLVSADPVFTTLRRQIVALAARYALPVVYPWQEYVEAGGLMSYGPILMKAYHDIGVYAARILKGEKPSNLPVQLPTTFELMINLKTAKALGLMVPQNLLALANQVIE